MPSYNNFGNEFGGFILCIMSFVKVVVITFAFVSAAALAWSVPAAFAKAIKPETAARCLRGREEGGEYRHDLLVSVQCADQLVRAANLRQRDPGSGPALFRSVLHAEMRGLTARF